MKARNIVLLGFLLSIGCKTVPDCKRCSSSLGEKHIPAMTPFAKATLEQKSGSNVQGRATFEMTQEGMLVNVTVDNASPGLHGIHIHEKGDCSSPDAMSAGAHYNPDSLIHGSPDPRKFHLGDLGNISVNKDGHGELKLLIPASNFNPNGPEWTTIVGKSLVVHAKADDLMSQPAGDSGSRIACGVIMAE